tara:strand:- start:4844 stop:7609 length:2766 start_codon:yes stop_codon:yes gene_type:complete
MRVIGKTEEVGKHTATVSGTLPDGKGVMLNRDGQLVKVTNSSVRQSPQGAIDFNSTQVDKNIRSCVANGHVVIMYRDNESSSNYYGKVIVGSINAESGLITFGAEAIFYQAVSTGYYGIDYDSNSDRILLSYTHSSASGQHAYLRVGEINYTNKTVQFGTELQLSYTTSFYTDVTFCSNVNKFLVLYRTSNDLAVAATIDPDNNSVSIGTTLTWDTNGHNYMKGTFDSNANKVLVVFKDEGDGGKGAVRSFQINVGSPDTVSNPVNQVQFYSSGIENPDIHFDPSTNCCLITWTQSSTNYGWATVCKLAVNGTPSFPENASSQIRTWIFRSYSGAGPNSITLNTSTNIFMVAHEKQSNNNGMQTPISILVADSGDVSTIGLVQYNSTDQVSFANIASYQDVVYEPVSDRVVFNYADNSTPNRGKSMVYAMGQQKILNETPVFIGDMGVGFKPKVCWAGSNKILVAWYNQSDNKIKCRIGTVTDTGVTYGNSADIHSGQSPTTASRFLDMVYDSGNGKIVIFYSHGSNSYLMAIIGTISGTTTTWTGNVVVVSEDISNMGCAYYDSTNKKVGYFYKSATNNKLYAKQGTIDPTTLDGGNTSWLFNNFGSAHQVDDKTNSEYQSVCYNKTDDTILFNWVEYGSSSDRYAKLRIGRSYSYGNANQTNMNGIRLKNEHQNGRINWDVNDMRDTMCMHVPSKNVVIMAYRDQATSNHFNYTTGKMEGLGWNDESVGSTGTVYSTAVEPYKMDMVWDESFDKGIFIYGSSSETFIKTFTMSNAGALTMSEDLAIPFGEVSSASGLYKWSLASADCAYIPTIERTVIVSRLDDNGNNAANDRLHSYVFRADGSNLQNLNSTFIGISSSNKVDIKGSINTSAKSQYGNAFTVGSRYYITTEGELVDNQGATTSVFAGTALSSTELLVKS